MQLRKVYQNGNGLVFVIPPKMAAALAITKGSQVMVRLENQALVVSRAVIMTAASMRRNGIPEDKSSE